MEKKISEINSNIRYTLLKDKGEYFVVDSCSNWLVHIFPAFSPFIYNTAYKIHSDKADIHFEDEDDKYNSRDSIWFLLPIILSLSKLTDIVDQEYRIYSTFFVRLLIICLVILVITFVHIDNLRKRKVKLWANLQMTDTETGVMKVKIISENLKRTIKLICLASIAQIFCTLLLFVSLNNMLNDYIGISNLIMFTGATMYFTFAKQIILIDDNFKIIKKRSGKNA